MIAKKELEQIRLIIREELECAFGKLREIIVRRFEFDDLDSRVKYTELKLSIESGE